GPQLRAVGDVALERLLRRDRDALDLRLEPARVDAAGTVAEQRADLAREEPAELCVVERGEGPDRRDPRRAQPLLGARPDAGQEPDVERRQKRRLAPGADYGQPARLAPVGRDLGDDL